MFVYAAGVLTGAAVLLVPVALTLRHREAGGHARRTVPPRPRRRYPSLAVTRIQHHLPDGAQVQIHHHNNGRSGR